jgi:hypothetical protein
VGIPPPRSFPTLGLGGAIYPGRYHPEGRRSCHYHLSESVMLLSGSHAVHAEGSQVCVCGRSFSQSNAFSKHKRSCEKSKKRLSSALEKAKHNWTSKKRRRLEPPEPSISLSSADLIPEPVMPREQAEVCLFYCSQEDDM